MAEARINRIENDFLGCVRTSCHLRGQSTDCEDFKEFRGAVSICNILLAILFEGFEDGRFISLCKLGL